jgi:hypothetical protein
MAADRTMRRAACTWSGFFRREGVMEGKAVVEQIAEVKNEGHQFIKWWRRADDVVDYEFIDRFIARVRPDEEIDGFELLDLEGMWEVLLSLDPDKLARVNRDGKEVIQWVWQDTGGAERSSTYPFSAEGIMTLFDEELFS